MEYDAIAIKTGSQRWLGRTSSVKSGSSFLTIRGGGGAHRASRRRGVVWSFLRGDNHPLMALRTEPERGHEGASWGSRDDVSG
jgi:hypothetical protein